ncbi:MAG: HEAT repeat domain-containing protein [Verrucomicrobia bacterium]|nr:HEAT repeat domain-containing protein [Verrucomicrobiota bacterium]
MNKRLSLTFLFLTAVALFALVQTDPYAALPSYDFGQKSYLASAIHRIRRTLPFLGQKSDCIVAIQQEIREAKPAGYAAIEAKLLAVIAKPDATYACKKFVCEQLGIIGSEACVAPLLKQFGDAKTADVARLALEGLPSRTVSDGLLDALKSSKGKVQIGIIQTLAARHNPELVGVVKGYLDSGNAELIRTSLQALGRVGSASAVEALKTAQVPTEFESLREQSLLDAAINLAKVGSKSEAVAVFDEEFKKGKSLPAVIGAMNGLVDFGDARGLIVMCSALKDQRPQVALAAAKAAQRMENEAVTKELCSALPGLPPAFQVAVLRTLAERSDKSALPAVKVALGSREEAVKIEAVFALNRVGDSSVVADLITLATAEGDVAIAAQQTLGQIDAKGVNKALTKILDDADVKKVRMAVLTLKARADRSIMARLLAMASSEKDDLRGAALDALEGFAGMEEMPALLGLLEKADNKDNVASVLWKATQVLGKEDERFAKLWASASGCSESAIPWRAPVLGRAR